MTPNFSVCRYMRRLSGVVTAALELAYQRHPVHFLFGSPCFDVQSVGRGVKSFLSASADQMFRSEP